MTHACENGRVTSRCCRFTRWRPFSEDFILGPASRRFVFSGRQNEIIVQRSSQNTTVYRLLLNWFPCKQPLIDWWWSRSQWHVEWRKYWFSVENQLYTEPQPLKILWYISIKELFFVNILVPWPGPGFCRNDSETQQILHWTFSMPSPQFSALQHL